MSDAPGGGTVSDWLFDQYDADYHGRPDFLTRQKRFVGKNDVGWFS